MSDIMLFAHAAHTIASSMPMDDLPAAVTVVGKGLAYGLAAAGSGVGIGLVFASAIQGVARQPEQAGQLRQLMLLGFALIEVLALLGFALVFILK